MDQKVGVQKHSGLHAGIKAGEDVIVCGRFNGKYMGPVNGAPAGSPHVHLVKLNLTSQSSGADANNMKEIKCTTEEIRRA